MKTTIIPIKITFTEPLLGSQSNNAEVLREYQKTKAPTLDAANEEIEAVPAEEAFEKQMTVFPKDDNGLFLWDYQVKGFFKEAIRTLVEMGEAPKLKAYRKAVDDFVFIRPRRIYLQNGTGPIKAAESVLQRPLRAQTMQGERIALAASESLPAGTSASFEIELLEASKDSKAINRAMIMAALEYGKFKGLGQWRNASHGRFDAIEQPYHRIIPADPAGAK